MMRSYIPYREEWSQIRGKFHPRRPKSKKIEQEYGPGKTNILVCRKCYAVYWSKSWHHRLKDYGKLKEGKRIKFTLCPACQMIKDKKYEGEIILENVPKCFKEDIKKLAKNYGERAFKDDPMDRIISIKEKRVRRVTTKRKRGHSSREQFRGLKDIRILITENQLAKRLAKKINEIYGGKLFISISHSHREDAARIKIKF